MKGADHVLAARRVDGGLAADRRIHLGQNRGRDLHKIDAALIDGRRETRQVADHAAAKGGDDIAPVQPFGQQGVAQGFQMVEALGLFPRR